MSLFFAFRTSRVFLHRNNLSLSVSSPALLLNHVAQRYSDTPRIVMEFVDNSLDDAESLFDPSTNQYNRPVTIDVVVDRQTKSLLVRDNANGMNRSQLERIVRNVGDSNKRGQPFLNGQFGFGVHSFRAAANKLTIRSRHKNGEGTFVMELDRLQNDNIAPPKLLHSSFPTDTGTGTEVLLSEFDSAWMEGLDASRISHEIEAHFDRLLARSNLTVAVSDTKEYQLEKERQNNHGGGGTLAHICRAFDLSNLPGTSVVESLQVPNSGEMIHVQLKVVDQPMPLKQVCVYCNGRRINEMGSLKSFMKVSHFRSYVWSHPNLVGFIEVGSALQPVITRDEFQTTTARGAVYRLLTKKVEPALKDLIDNKNLAHYDDVIHGLEYTVSRCFVNALKAKHAPPKKVILPFDPETKRKVKQEEIQEDLDLFNDNNDNDNVNELNASAPDQQPVSNVEAPEENNNNDAPAHDPAPETDTKSANEDALPVQPKAPRQPPEPAFMIQFVKSLPGDNGEEMRSAMIGKIIHINMNHPDFVSRTKFDKQGHPTFGDRLSSYISCVVSSAYLAKQETGVPVPQVLTDLVSTMLAMENKLRRKVNTPVITQKNEVGNNDNNDSSQNTTEEQHQ